MSDEAKKTAHLFQKGQSGNPGGRPKGLERTAREAMALRSYVAKDGNKYEGVEAAMQCLIDMFFDEKVPPRVRITAFTEWSNRGYGRTKQHVTVTGDGPTVTTGRNPEDMTDGELADALGAIRRLKQLGAIASATAEDDGDGVSEH